MQKKSYKLACLAAVAGLGILSVGCSNPMYKREITYKYDAEGKLLGSEVRMEVTQMDPHQRPLRKDLNDVRTKDLRNLEGRGNKK